MQVQAVETTKKDFKQPVLVTIDGEDYDATAFMDWVIQYTERSVMAEEIYNQQNKGNSLNAIYNEYGQRIIVEVGKKGFCHMMTITE